MAHQGYDNRVTGLGAPGDVRVREGGGARSAAPVVILPAMLPLVSVKRERFVRYLLEERKEKPGELAPA